MHALAYKVWQEPLKFHITSLDLVGRLTTCEGDLFALEYHYLCDLIYQHADLAAFLSAY